MFAAKIGSQKRNFLVLSTWSLYKRYANGKVPEKVAQWLRMSKANRKPCSAHNAFLSQLYWLRDECTLFDDVKNYC